MWYKTVNISLGTSAQVFYLALRFHEAPAPESHYTKGYCFYIRCSSQFNSFSIEALLFFTSQRQDYRHRHQKIRMKSLARIRTFITEQLAVQLYKSFMPHINYGDVVYDAASKKDCNTLQVIQNGCLRICCKVDPRTPIVELHCRVNIPTLTTRRVAHSSNLVYNGLNDKSVGLNQMFKCVHDTHEVNTRASSSHMVNIPKYRLAKSEGNLHHRGAKYFNELPHHVKVSANINIFKSRVKALNSASLNWDVPFI